MLLHNWSIGDTVYLKEPYRGYRTGEIVGFNDYGKIEIELTSGKIIDVYADEIEH